jgi:hypothetical protein
MSAPTNSALSWQIAANQVVVESDSEDEALLHEKSAGDSDASMTESQFTTRVPLTENASDLESDAVHAQGNEEEKSMAERKVSDIIDAPGPNSILIQQESTRYLAFGLLDLDVGYSSDEGGDEDVAYYVSNVELFRHSA